MIGEPICVQASMPVSEFVEEELFVSHHQFYPVLDGTRLVGAVTFKAVKELPREKWGRRTVDEIMRPLRPDIAVREDEPLAEVFKRMGSSGDSRLLVVEERGLAGIVTLKDVTALLTIRMELESGGPAEEPGQGESK